jgi:hypothetical protein
MPQILLQVVEPAPILVQDFMAALLAELTVAVAVPQTQQTLPPAAAVQAGIPVMAATVEAIQVQMDLLLLLQVPAVVAAVAVPPVPVLALLHMPAAAAEREYLAKDLTAEPEPM